MLSCCGTECKKFTESTTYLQFLQKSTYFLNFNNVFVYIMRTPVRSESSNLYII